MKLIAPAVTALLLLTIAKISIAEPLLTTPCENPKGFRMQHGVCLMSPLPTPRVSIPNAIRE
jgi:hypothetical protein